MMICENDIAMGWSSAVTFEFANGWDVEVEVAGDGRVSMIARHYKSNEEIWPTLSDDRLRDGDDELVGFLRYVMGLPKDGTVNKEGGMTPWTRG